MKPIKHIQTGDIRYQSGLTADELADALRKNKTIDWQIRESARAKMRMLIKKLLKKHRYPPEGMAYSPI